MVQESNVVSNCRWEFLYRSWVSFSLGSEMSLFAVVVEEPCIGDDADSDAGGEVAGMDAEAWVPQ